MNLESSFPRPSTWYRRSGFVFGFLVVLVIAIGLVFGAGTIQTYLHRVGISLDFSFLGKEAGFGIGESVINYSPMDSYGTALMVGILNTVKVSVISIVIATVLGVILGVAQLSRNWLLAKIVRGYIDLIRSIPFLVQLIIWWNLFRISAPRPAQAWEFGPGFFVSNRGLTFPFPVYDPAYAWMIGVFFAAVIASVVVSKLAIRRKMKTGQDSPALLINLGMLIGLPAVIFVLSGTPLVLDVPALRGLNFRGGAEISPEFAALTFGLAAYGAAFMAEIVRAGILSVEKGQREAAAVLGLRPGLTMRFVIMPQALRVMIPPTTNQYIDLIKTSSLAVVVGYPELTSIGNTTLNQTGQALSCILIMMVTYLLLSLITSGVMNLLNRSVQVVSR
ncbi:amino acid ABC transporter permease [Pseudomonas sp. DWRC2-2]|uniref:amino acid ABC transporter permease n=1 Tax=Pseudomonas sp. DWRC2-2 TaxID=2804567 RepID=UPI003CFB1FCF